MEQIFCLEKEAEIAKNITFIRDDEVFTFKDEKGRILFTKNLKRCYPFNEGYAVVVLENFDYAILDDKGNISDARFELLGQKFSEGKNFALFSDLSTGCIDTNGNLLFKIQLDWKDAGALEITPFSNGRALIKESANTWILIEETGNSLKKFNFFHASEFKCGFSRIQFRNGKLRTYNYLDKDGNLLSSDNFDEAEDFVNNTAKVKIGNNSFYIDTKGKLYSKKPVSDNGKTYLKFEYDFADYLTNVNGRGEVFINESNKNDCFVELYFYTSMYQLYYYISFTEDEVIGFSEKTNYKELYKVENSTKERLENFKGKKADILNQSETSRKYISLALKLMEESLK